MKKSICLFLCVLLTGACVGCQSRREPKNMGVVNSVLYDIGERGGYEVTAEIMNPSASEGTQQSAASNKNPSITITGKGQSIREAVTDITVTLEQDIFAGHNKVRFFSEGFAKRGMAGVLDFLARDHLADETPYMAVIRDPAPKDIYFSSIALSDMIGNYIERMTKSQPRHSAKGVFVTTLDFIRDYYAEGKQPVMGLIRLESCEDKPSLNTDGTQVPVSTRLIRYEGLAAFKGDKLAGYMDGKEAQVYRLLTTEVDSAFITIPIGDDNTVLEISHSRADKRVSFSEGRAVITVDVKASLRVVTAGQGIDFSRPGPVRELEEEFDQRMEKQIAAAVHKAQHQFGSDIFGFGAALHAQDPEQWRRIKDRWDESFSGADLCVSVESSIIREGEIKQPISMEDAGE